MPEAASVPSPRSYADACARFSWQDSLGALGWSAGVDVNLADTIVERYAGHPAVAEAAVVGKPDALRGQIVKAFVVLRPGAPASSSLADEIVDLVKSRVGRHQYPREVEVVRELPKTETGKIQRFLLRSSQTRETS